MTNNTWYKKSYRRNLVDMHIEDWDDRFLSKFEPKVYVEMLKKAKVQTAMIYANTHLGYCYWPTKTGHMHRGLKGRDIFGEVSRLSHNEGMDVVAYYSLIYNSWACDNNPSWDIIDVNGKKTCEFENKRGRYRKCCPNAPGYRAFVESQIKELCENYEFEGIFYDMTFWPEVCYCPSCKERYIKEVGSEIPVVVDFNNPNWVAFQKKREEWLTEFASFATSVARKYKPSVTVEHNSATFTHPWNKGTTIDLVSQNDYIGGDFYGGFLQQSFICKLYESITLNKPFEYMTSRCDPNLTDHTTQKSKEALAMHNYIALAHNGAFMFIDAIDPVGTINPRLYEVMGEIFEQSMKYESYLGGNMIKDIAVYFSLDSKMDKNSIENTPLFAQPSYPHLEAALGSARTLKLTHIPFGVVSKCNLNNLSDYQVVILPDLAVISKEETEAIEMFAENGGNVYISGGDCFSFLSDIFGITLDGKTDGNISYIAPNEEGEKLFPGVNIDYPLCVFKSQLKVKAELGEVLATITLPYTKPDFGSKFASIHSNPPGIITSYPAAIYRKYGRGGFMWISASIEVSKQEPHRKAFESIIRSLVKKPLAFEVDAPAAVDAVLFHQPENKRYIFNMVNEQEELPPIPIYNIKIKLLMNNKRVERVYLLPNEEALNYVVKDGYIEINAPMLEMFQMIAVDYK